MKNITAILAILSGIFLLGNTVSAQDTDLEIQAISVESVEVAEIEFVEVAGETRDSDGTELDDIGVVSEESETTAGFLKIDSIEGESVETTGIESDEIDATIVDPEPTPISVEREMKESGEKGGTEDINIGVGELQEATDTEHKDWIIIESMSSPIQKSELVDEILDIEEEAESSKSKPREIVVVGSKVRDEQVAQVDSFFDIWIDAGEDRNAAPDSFFDIFIDAGEERSAPDSFFDIFVDVSDEDVQLQAISVAQADENVEEVDVTQESVRVDHRETLRLFGIIPIETSRSIIVQTDPEATDRVKVQFPWWSFLATSDTDSVALAEEIERGLAVTIPVPEGDADDRPTEEVAFYYNKIKAQTLQTISNVSK